jgi:hypothetical protein
MMQAMMGMGSMGGVSGSGNNGQKRSWDSGGDWQPSKKSAGPRACWYYLRGICSEGQQCKFSHDHALCQAAAIADPDAATWKATMCTYINRKGGCKFGHMCHGAHSPEELREMGSLLLQFSDPAGIQALQLQAAGMAGRGGGLPMPAAMNGVSAADWPELAGGGGGGGGAAAAAGMTGMGALGGQLSLQDLAALGGLGGLGGMGAAPAPAPAVPDLNAQIAALMGMVAPQPALAAPAASAATTSAADQVALAAWWAQLQQMSAMGAGK